MKKKLVATLCLVAVLAVTGCQKSQPAVETQSQSQTQEEPAVSDQEAADAVAELIDAIYVQKWTDDTPEKCKAAKDAWDALTDAQKALVEGEEASPEYFGLDTGDASLDDTLNADNIGENEILVVSFGTSYNDSRVEDIGGIEKAIAKANPDWSVRRAFTAQIIINHILARDGMMIDNMDQALERAVNNGVKNLVVQPTHLMQGYEYDELVESLMKYEDKFESVKISEPMLGVHNEDATVINDDKKIVIEAVANAAAADSSFATMKEADEAGVAYVFLGHGTAHAAQVTYTQMQNQLTNIGYKNCFVGTVEGEPEETEVMEVIKAVKEAGYKKVVLRPIMVVAGDHANNDMAGEDEDSWKSLFMADGSFESVDAQISGLGSIEAVQELFVSHLKAVL